MTFSCGPENVVDCGDFGGPKADINERTMQGEVSWPRRVVWNGGYGGEPRFRGMMNKETSHRCFLRIRPAFSGGCSCGARNWSRCKWKRALADAAGCSVYQMHRSANFSLLSPVSETRDNKDNTKLSELTRVVAAMYTIGTRWFGGDGRVKGL